MIPGLMVFLVGLIVLMAAEALANGLLQVVGFVLLIAGVGIFVIGLVEMLLTRKPPR